MQSSNHAAAWLILFVALAGQSDVRASATLVEPVSPPVVADARAPAALIDISDVPLATVDGLKPSTDDGWWLELGDQLLVAGNLSRVRAETPATRLRELGSLAPADLVLHARGCGDSTLAPSLTLVTGLNYDLMRQTPATRSASASSAHASHLGAPEWLPVVANSVIARRFESPEGSALPADPAIVPIVARVDAVRWFGDVEALAAFDRSSFSSELALARAYIAQQFAALGLAVSEPEFQFTYGGQPATVRNVIGTWTGSRNPTDLIVVGGHYDSRNSVNGAPLDTPGADDNATGCSGVMEAARVLTRFRPTSTVLFMCYAGEEQGLHGSAAHVSALNVEGILGRVSHMANMDMIGWSATPDVGVLIGTTGAPQNVALMQDLAEAAETYVPELGVMTTTNTCCSDHMPYLNAGRPAVFSIHRGSAAAYPHYHRATDLPPNLGPHAQAVGGAIIRMNVAALATWTGASDRIFADTFSN